MGASYHEQTPPGLSLQTVEVPQVQFSPESEDILSGKVDTVQTVLLGSVMPQFMAVFMARWCGWGGADCVAALFALLQVVWS